MTEPNLSVVIPVYNGEHTVGQLVPQLEAVLAARGKPYEIILVNDGSRDGSWSVMEQLHAQSPTTVTIIELMRNFGQHNAIMCGLREARGELIVTMDDDLQHPAAEVLRLIDAIEGSDLDLIYGIDARKKHSVYRNVGSALAQKFYRLVFGLSNGVSAFRVIRRPLALCILDYQLNYTYLDGLFAWNTNRIGQVPVEHRERTVGQSGYSLRRLMVLALNLFTNFSLLPLQLVSVTGFVVAMLGFLTGLYYGWLRLIDQIEVPGFASLIIAVMMLGGIQMLSIGIIGEYLGRLHINNNQKPQYKARTIRRGRG